MAQTNDLSWFRIIRPTLQTMANAVHENVINPTDVYVYLSIKSFAHHTTGIVEKSIPEICNFTGLSPATVKRSIAKLKKNEFLRNHNRSGSINRYYLVEHAPLVIEGKPQIAKWEYIPANETKVRNELKRYLAGEGLSENVGVNIENLTLNVVQNVVNIHLNGNSSIKEANEQLESMWKMIKNPKTPENIKKQLNKIYPQLKAEQGQI